MSTTRSNRDSFEAEVRLLLEDCRNALNGAIAEKASAMLVRDLTAAVSSLELIDRDLRVGNGRPIGHRSCQFVRYVIDEGEYQDHTWRDELKKQLHEPLALQ